MCYRIWDVGSIEGVARATGESANPMDACLRRPDAPKPGFSALDATRATVHRASFKTTPVKRINELLGVL